MSPKKKSRLQAEYAQTLREIHTLESEIRPTQERVERILDQVPRVKETVETLRTSEHFWHPNVFAAKPNATPVEQVALEGWNRF